MKIDCKIKVENFALLVTNLVELQVQASDILRLPSLQNHENFLTELRSPTLFYFKRYDILILASSRGVDEYYSI